MLNDVSGRERGHGGNAKADKYHILLVILLEL